MSVIHQTTEINAPIDTVFDLSRSVDLHMISTHHTNETVLAGKTSRLCNTGDTIIWKAKHLGFYQRLTVEIVSCEVCTYFVDRMKKGAFKSFTHKHYFYRIATRTLMKDVIEFESPFGFVGKIFNVNFLKGYMTRLLVRQNEVIKTYAESSDGHKILSDLY